MAKRGRKKLPVTVLKARGTYRADRHADRSELEVSIPAKPEGMTKEAERVWNWVVLRLANSGLIAEIDRDIIAAYCQVVVDFREIQKYCKKGLLIKTKNGNEIQNPAFSVRNRCLELMIKIGSMFYMTPSERLGIKTFTPDRPPRGKPGPFRIPRFDAG